VLEEAASRVGERAAAARAMARRRAGGEPLQYVLGHWPFRELDLVVDHRALIPRPETEVLVGLALDRLAVRHAGGRAPAVVVDLGCGTGAIALSIATEAPARDVVERPSLARELDFEPELALVADDSSDGTPGLAAVAAVIEGAPAWLAPGGVLLVEHGDTQRAGALALAAAAGLVDVRDHDDLAGRPRVLEAHRST